MHFTGQAGDISARQRERQFKIKQAKVQQELYVSKYSLRISDTAIQKEFIQYLRQQTKYMTKWVVLFFMIFTVLSIALFLLSDEESNSVNIMLVVHTSIPTVLLTCVLVAAHYRDCFIEFAGSSVILPTLCIIYLTYFRDVFVDSSTLRQQ